MPPYEFATQRAHWAASMRPSTDDPAGILTHLIVAIVTHHNLEDKPRQLVLGHSHPFQGEHSFQYPMQELGAWQYHTWMDAFLDSMPENTGMGTFLQGAYQYALYAVRRWLFNKQAILGWMVRLLLEHTRCWKEGARLVKVIDLTRNQAKELTQYINQCHRGPHLGNSEGARFTPTAEDESVQWHKVST